MSKYLSLILVVFALICYYLGWHSGQSPELYVVALIFFLLFLLWITISKLRTGLWFTNKSRR